jgi:predicted membrane protein DUF2231
MEINGLPLHPLVVHAAVIFGPLAALAALAYALVPRWRDRLRWPMLVLVLIATASIWAAFLTGENFRDSQSFYNEGALGDKIDKHEELAEKLRIMTSGFAVVAIVAAWLHGRTGPTRAVLSVLLALAAVGTLVLTVLTGDAGARAVWGK